MDFSKKSARRVSRLLNKEMKKEGVNTCKMFVVTIHRCGSLTILDNILTASKLAEGEEGAGWPNIPPGETSAKGL